LPGGVPRPDGHFWLPYAPGSHGGACAPVGLADKSVSWAFSAFAAPFLNFFKSHQNRKIKSAPKRDAANDPDTLGSAYTEMWRMSQSAISANCRYFYPHPPSFA
jgi:hypothetical protein